MSEIASAIAKEGAEGGLAAARGFLSRLLGPATDEAGLILQEKVRMYRLKNPLRVLSKAQAMIQKADLEPKQVPLRTLLPLLDGASLEDDETLSEKWAGLLASSASLAGEAGPHPSYPRILQDLSPLEASILDRLEALGGSTG